MALSGIYGSISRQQAKATIGAALEVGVRLFDTAPLYGNGDNEELLGQTLLGQEVEVSSKFGLYSGSDGKLYRDSRPETIRNSVEASLRRLRRDRIDVLFQHRPDPAVNSREIAEAVLKLIREGKVGAFGLSAVSIREGDEMATHLPIAALQNELSLAAPANGHEPIEAQSRGWSYFAFAPLGRGLLTGRVQPSDDFRSKLSLKDGGELPVKLGQLARRLNVGPAAIALSWVMGRAENVIAIPGCRSPQQVREAVAAQDLDAADVAMLTAELG